MEEETFTTQTGTKDKQKYRGKTAQTEYDRRQLSSGIARTADGEDHEASE
jgi:hypothetical protein